MKRSIPLVIIFLILLLLLELGYTFIKKDHVEEYMVDNYNVRELYKDGSYYLSIDNGQEYYKYQTDINFNKTTNIIEKILTYTVNGYKCIYPIYKENSFIREESKYNDIECFNNGNIYTGDALKNSLDLSGFKNIIIKNNGSYRSWEKSDNTIKYTADGNIYLAEVPGLYLTAINSDNTHFYVSSKTVNYVEDFVVNISSINDVGFAGSYFLYPNTQGLITKFGYVELLSGNTGEIESAYKISRNSYANGSYKNELYIYDLDLNKQYKISKLRVSEASKNETSLYYNGEKAEFIENAKFANRLRFNTSNDGNLSYYVKNNNVYKVYNGDAAHPVIIYRGYASGIKASKNYVLFSTGRDVYLYNDTLGLIVFYHSTKENVSENKYNLYVR